MRDLVTFTFNLEQLSYMVGSFMSYELYRFPLITIENAYAATAHVPNHATREKGVKNNYIFEIPDPDLPIHYTTFIGLRRRLRVVYSRPVEC